MFLCVEIIDDRIKIAHEAAQKHEKYEKQIMSWTKASNRNFNQIARD